MNPESDDPSSKVTISNALRNRCLYTPIKKKKKKKKKIILSVSNIFLVLRISRYNYNDRRPVVKYRKKSPATAVNQIAGTLEFRPLTIKNKLLI